MADLTNYAGLCATIEEWLGRDDLKEQIPVFIQLAEKRMNRELRLRVMERRAETDVLAGQPAVPLPWRREAGNWDVFMEMRDIVWQGADGISHSLTYAPADDYAETRTVGLPRQYTIIGRDLFLLPASEADGKLRLTYYAEIPPLGDKQPDNLVLLTAPDVYLYASLVEAAPYTRGSAPAEQWAQFYGAAKAKLESSEQRARFTSNLTMRPVRRT
jgi:hypothetical protein